MKNARRLAEIVRTIGFNASASESVKEALVRHLVRDANATSPQNSSTNFKQELFCRQLSFDPTILGITSPTPLSSRAKRTK